MLAEQHGTELLEPRWGIVERPDDRLALGDRQASTFVVRTLRCENRTGA